MVPARKLEEVEELVRSRVVVSILFVSVLLWLNVPTMVWLSQVLLICFASVLSDVRWIAVIPSACAVNIPAMVSVIVVNVRKTYVRCMLIASTTSMVFIMATMSASSRSMLCRRILDIPLRLPAVWSTALLGRRVLKQDSGRCVSPVETCLCRCRPRCLVKSVTMRLPNEQNV